MLSQLEMEQAELSEKKNFLDIHLYITTFSGTKDMKAVTLKLALDLMHQKVHHSFKRNIMKVIIKRTTSKFVKIYVHKNTFSIFHYILLSFPPNNCPGLYTSRKIEITMYREKTILGFRMCNIW